MALGETEQLQETQLREQRAALLYARTKNFDLRQIHMWAKNLEHGSALAAVLGITTIVLGELLNKGNGNVAKKVRTYTRSFGAGLTIGGTASHLYYKEESGLSITEMRRRGL